MLCNYVSLIITVYNDEKHLPKLFDSIKDLDYPFLDVIFVNDGSTDNSQLLIEKFCLIDLSKYRLVSKPNGGLNSARKVGIELSKYDLIMFCDSDDYFESNYISSLVEHIDEADIVFAPIITEDEEGNFISILNNSKKEVEFWNKEQSTAKILRNFDVGNYLPGKLFKKALFSNVDFSYNKSFEDYTISHILFNNVNKVCKVNKPTYHYIKRNKSLSTKTKESYLSCLDAIMIRRKWVLDNYSDNIEYLNLVDLSLFDRFIQTIHDYFIPRNSIYYRKIKYVYKTDKSKLALNKYCSHNLPLYFLSPYLYHFIRKIYNFMRGQNSNG